MSPAAHRTCPAVRAFHFYRCQATGPFAAGSGDSCCRHTTCNHGTPCHQGRSGSFVTIHISAAFADVASGCRNSASVFWDRTSEQEFRSGNADCYLARAFAFVALGNVSRLVINVLYFILRAHSFQPRIQSWIDLISSSVGRSVRAIRTDRGSNKSRPTPRTRISSASRRGAS